MVSYKFKKIFRDGLFETSQKQQKHVSYEPVTEDASPSTACKHQKREKDLPESVSSWRTGLTLCRRGFPQSFSNRAHSPHSLPSDEKRHVEYELQFGQKNHYYII